MPSVAYADFLAVTLPAWRAIVPSGTIVRVVTSRDDEATKRIARAHGAKLCVTDAWRHAEARFNKALALDRAFGFVGRDAAPDPGDLCLSVDADVYPFGRFPRLDTLEPGVIYGCPRFHCESPRELDAHRAGNSRLEDLPLMPPLNPGQRTAERTRYTAAAARRAALKCLGFFQLFRYEPGLRFGSSPTAGGYDLRFRDRFPRREALSDVYVLHLGDRDRANWGGRVVKPWASVA